MFTFLLTIDRNQMNAKRKYWHCMALYFLNSFQDLCTGNTESLHRLKTKWRPEEGKIEKAKASIAIIPGMWYENCVFNKKMNIRFQFIRVERQFSLSFSQVAEVIQK